MNMNDMDSRYQRIYKITRIDGQSYVFDGDRRIAFVRTTYDVVVAVLCNHMNIRRDEYKKHKEEIRRLNAFFSRAYFDRGGNLNGYVVCGLTIEECINERERSKNIQSP